MWLSSLNGLLRDTGFCRGRKAAMKMAEDQHGTGGSQRPIVFSDRSICRPYCHHLQGHERPCQKDRCAEMFNPGQPVPPPAPRGR